MWVENVGLCNVRLLFYIVFWKWNWKTNLMGCVGIIWRHHKYLGANAGGEWCWNMKPEVSICIFHTQEHETGSILRVIMSYLNRDLTVAAKCKRNLCLLFDCTQLLAARTVFFLSILWAKFSHWYGAAQNVDRALRILQTQHSNGFYEWLPQHYPERMKIKDKSAQI